MSGQWSESRRWQATIRANRWKRWLCKNGRPPKLSSMDIRSIIDDMMKLADDDEPPDDATVDELIERKAMANAKAAGKKLREGLIKSPTTKKFYRDSLKAVFNNKKKAAYMTDMLG